MIILAIAESIRIIYVRGTHYVCEVNDMITILEIWTRFYDFLHRSAI
jgi:hypothetical protein